MKSRDPALGRARWHLIGTYQRRKVRESLQAISIVHSVHSVPLARTIAHVAAELGSEVDCLLQVNVSGEASKQGFPPGEARAALDAVRALPGLRWRGLMTMAPAEASPAERRRVFAATRDLRDRLKDENLPLPDLSMGMSSDYAEAVLEGSTLIRIGTALFHVAKGDPAS
jgi:pyridoxal phosphate enzyme (YggS family)